MTQEDLDFLFLRQPPPLLRLHLTGGMVYDISDPDLVVLTRSTIEFPLRREGPIFREAVIDLRHIVWVEVVTEGR